MARIYNQQTYQTGYQGSAQSVGFSPVRALDGSQREKQRAQDQVESFQAIGKMQKTQAQIDELRLQKQKEEGLAWMQLQANKSNTKAKAFQSLLSLTQAGISAYGQVAQNLEIQQKKQEAEAAQQAKLAQTMAGMYGGGWNPEQIQQEAQTEQMVQAQGQAIGAVATGLEVEGSATSVSAAETARQGNPARQYSFIQGNAYTARAAFPAALQQAWDSVPYEARPKTAGAIQQWAQNFTYQFAQASGIAGLPQKTQAEILGPSVMNAQAQFLQGVLTNTIKAERSENKNTVQTQVSQIMMAEGIPASMKMEQVLSLMRNGNIGYDGVNSFQLNSDAVDMVLAQAAAAGDTKFISDLYVSYKIPGQKGTEWGREFDHKFQQAFKKARQAGISSYNLTQNEAKIQIADVQQQMLDGSITREQALAKYRAIGTPLALQSANNMISQGLAYDPDKKFDIAQRAAEGNPYTVAELNSMLQRGIINDKEFKTATKGMASIENMKLAASTVKPLLKGLQESATSGISKGNLDPSAASELPFRMDLAGKEITQRLTDALNANPGLASSPGALQAEALRIKDEVMKQDQFRVEVTAGNPPKFAAPMPVPEKSAFTTVAPGIEDFSNVLPHQIPKLQGMPNLTLDPGKDRFLKPGVLRMQAEKLVAGQTIDENSHTAKMAAALGYSPATFIEAQLRQAGLPSLSTMRQVEASKATPAPTQSKSPLGAASGSDYDQYSGMQYLQSLGFPKRGAAYLSGNIQQESGWTGQRTWGEVMGDGSDRNGGLVSWMDDAQRNHFRLRNIERYMGKPISQASDAEQVQAMIWEMKRRNPWAYRTFMNPNATDAELRKASRHYWGYGHEGGRYRYAAALLAR